jgi:periplasmic copper chaperone A
VVATASRSQREDRANHKHTSRWLKAALCGVLMSAAAAQAAANDISIENGWLRLVVPERPAAGYFKLDNGTDAAIALVAASSSGCGQLMLHQSQTVNGIDTMRSVKGIVIPAHGSVSFTPGGYHLMCMSPAAALAPGASVPVTLKFADGRTVTSNFAVRSTSGN